MIRNNRENEVANQAIDDNLLPSVPSETLSQSNEMLSTLSTCNGACARLLLFLDLPSVGSMRATASDTRGIIHANLKGMCFESISDLKQKLLALDFSFVSNYRLEGMWQPIDTVDRSFIPVPVDDHKLPVVLENRVADRVADLMRQFDAALLRLDTPQQSDRWSAVANLINLRKNFQSLLQLHAAMTNLGAIKASLDDYYDVIEDLSELRYPLYLRFDDQNHDIDDVQQEAASVLLGDYLSPGQQVLADCSQAFLENMSNTYPQLQEREKSFLICCLAKHVGVELSSETSERGHPPVWAAYDKNDIQCMEAVLLLGANPNVAAGPLWAHDANGEPAIYRHDLTLLLEIAMTREPEADINHFATLLIEHGANVNASLARGGRGPDLRVMAGDLNESNVLSEAVYSGNFTLARILMEKGAVAPGNPNDQQILRDLVDSTPHGNPEEKVDFLSYLDQAY